MVNPLIKLLYLGHFNSDKQYYFQRQWKKHRLYQLTKIGKHQKQEDEAIRNELVTKSYDFNSQITMQIFDLLSDYKFDVGS